MKNTKLVWRLGKLPTPEEILSLVKDKVITQDEAREILFSSQEDTQRDVKSLESEIKFLRELVEKLSQNKDQIIKYVEILKPTYIQQPWYQPYYYWCGYGSSINCQSNLTGAQNAINLTNTTAGSLQGSLTNCSSNQMATGNTSFSSIQTF